MIEVLHDYWFLLAAFASIIGWMLVHSFKIGGLFQEFQAIKDANTKIGNGVEAKTLAQKNEDKINHIQTLCGHRGEQLVRMDTVIVNLNKTMDRFEQKLDKLSYAINKLVQDE